MQKKGESQRIGELPALGPGPVDVVGLGENSFDQLAVLPSDHALGVGDAKVELKDLVAAVGGQVATALVGCTRLGLVTNYLGSFGDDEAGRRVREALLGEGLNLDGSRTVATANRSALILVNPTLGHRQVLWQRAPALSWTERELPLARIAAARVLMVDATDVPAATVAARHARQSGVPVVADVDGDVEGLADLLQWVDVLVTSEGVPEQLTGAGTNEAALRQLHAQTGTRLIVTTLGGGGAEGWDGQRLLISPGYDVPVVDPTGAGDAFRAGLVAAWIEAGLTGQPAAIERLLDIANAVAALNCRATGAQAGLPSRQELTAFLTTGVPRRSKPVAVSVREGLR